MATFDALTADPSPLFAALDVLAAANESVLRRQAGGSG